MINNIIIIGAGPSGLMATISAKLHHKDANVILLERNKHAGRKLMLTGGGRCNVTANVNNNTVILNTPKNGKFLYSTLSNFNTTNIINFFNSNGCSLKEEDHNRMFPVTNKAIDIVNTLISKINELNGIIKYEHEVLSINKHKNEIITNKGTYKYEHLIVATGGKTVPQTGSDGNGYILAKSLGHNITDLLPAEVPLVSNDSFIHDKILQGLSFNDVEISVYKNNKVWKKITHDLLFTHFGISGPAALRASFYVIELLKKQDIVNLTIDFIPNENINNLSVEDLDILLVNNNIPKRLIKHIKTDNTIDGFKELLKKFPLSIYTTRGFNAAFLTNGGINTKEIDPSSMRSKLVRNISFCGEIIDYNAYTGGFNITSALSTGYTAGIIKD